MGIYETLKQSVRDDCDNHPSAWRYFSQGRPNANLVTEFRRDVEFFDPLKYEVRACRNGNLYDIEARLKPKSDEILSDDALLNLIASGIRSSSVGRVITEAATREAARSVFERLRQ